ncbi:MAG: GDP-mannose mannosyl hydrolase, partial [Planctomycetota bacterium]
MEIKDDEFINVIKLTPLVSIDLLIKNADGKYLLGLRENEPAGNYWFVPGGRI